MDDFWAGRRVLITGGSGFVGRHLVARLAAEGAKVSAPRRVHFDLCDEEETHALFARTHLAGNLGGSPQTVFHLAARIGGIGATSRSPADYIRQNLLMGIHVIDGCMRYCRNADLVVAGSVCAYPERIPMPMVEENLWAGEPEPTNGSYGVAKRTLLTLLEAYHKQHGLPSAYLLFANMYGPGDSYDLSTSHVIPALIRKVDEAKTRGDAGLPVWGSGGVSRDFLYVEDAVDALILAAQNTGSPTPINIGSGQEVYIGALVEQIKELMGYGGETCFDRSRPDGQARRCLRIWRAEKLLGWKPHTPFEEGLRHTIADFLNRKAEIYG